MCRLLGVASSEPTDFKFTLHDAPRSLSKLSSEHPDGWGIAVHDPKVRAWTIVKQIECAGRDERFVTHAGSAKGEMLVAHVRKRTVGPIGLQNTHPFARGRWMFAHNGTIDAMDAVNALVSPQRAAEIVGETDSERVFAALLTSLDLIGAGDSSEGIERRALDEAILVVMRKLVSVEGLGAVNFLLSDGDVLYAHRWGRTLYALVRTPADPRYDGERRSSETDLSLETLWSQRRRAVIVASERLTNEEWEEIPERTLLRIDRSNLPNVQLVE